MSSSPSPLDVLFDILYSIVVFLMFVILIIAVVMLVLLVLFGLSRFFLPVLVSLHFFKAPGRNVFGFFYTLENRLFAAKSNVDYFTLPAGTSVLGESILSFDSEASKKRFKEVNGLDYCYCVWVGHIRIPRMTLENLLNNNENLGFRDSRSYTTHVLDTLENWGYSVSSQARSLLVPLAEPEQEEVEEEEVQTKTQRAIKYLNSFFASWK